MVIKMKSHIKSATTISYTLVKFLIHRSVGHSIPVSISRHYFQYCQDKFTSLSKSIYRQYASYGIDGICLSKFMKSTGLNIDTLIKKFNA